jgi:hypothetical protein
MNKAYSVILLIFLLLIIFYDYNFDSVFELKNKIESFTTTEPGLSVSMSSTDSARQIVEPNKYPINEGLMDEINIKFVEHFIDLIPNVYPEFLLKSDCFEEETELIETSYKELLNNFVKLKNLNKLYYSKYSNICQSKSLDGTPDATKEKVGDVKGFCQLMEYLEKITLDKDEHFLDKNRYKTMSMIEFNTYVDLYYDFYFTRRFTPERLEKVRHVLFTLTFNLLKNNFILPKRQTNGYINEQEANEQNDTERLLDLNTYDYILQYTKLLDGQSIEEFKNSFTIPENVFIDNKPNISCLNHYYIEVKHLLDIIKFENYTIMLEEQRETDNKIKLIYEYKKGRMLYSTQEPELN